MPSRHNPLVREVPRLTSGFRLFVAALTVSLVSPGCHAASPVNAAAQSNIEDLEAAYYAILEFEKCVDRAPDAADPGVFEQRRRTAALIPSAEAKGLEAHLERAAAKWRRIDELADKICYFQMNDFKGRSSQLIRGANDRFELAISRF